MPDSPHDDALVPINFRVSRIEHAALEALRAALAAERGEPVPMAAVMRLLVRTHAAGLTASRAVKP